MWKGNRKIISEKVLLSSLSARKTLLLRPNKIFYAILLCGQNGFALSIV